MNVDPRSIKVGLEVVGSDGEPLGIVKAVREQDVLVDRALQRDAYVPLELVEIVLDDRVVLAITSSRFEATHWPSPPFPGSPPII